MLKKLWVLPVDIRLSAHSNKLRFRPRSYSYLGNVPVLDVFDRPITDWDVVMKWLFDKIVGGLALLLALSPLMALVAIADQARQPGPGVLQAAAPRLQQRADRGLQVPLALRRQDRSRRPQRASPRTIRASPASAVSSARPASTSCRSSSTWCSRATCRWSARGPHAVNQKIENRQFDEAVDGYFARHRVKPGITGWAQINGWRGEIDHAREDQAAASSTTSTTSRTGRCCSTFTSWRRRRWRCSSPRTPTDDRAAPRCRRCRPRRPSPGLAFPTGTAALPAAVADRRERRDRVHRAEPLRGGVVPDARDIRRRRADAVARRCCRSACCWS